MNIARVIFLGPVKTIRAIPCQISILQKPYVNVVLVWMKMGIQPDFVSLVWKTQDKPVLPPRFHPAKPAVALLAKYAVNR